MKARTKIVIQALAASTVLAVIGVTYNATMLTAPLPVETVSMEVDVAPRVRAMEEHGEEMAPPDYELESIQSEIDRRTIELEELEMMERAVGERMRTPDESRMMMERKQVLRQEINELHMRQIEILDHFYPPAAGSEPPGADEGIYEMSAPSVPEPSIVMESAPEGFWAGVNARYILDKLFNILWGLGQIIIGGWAAVKFKAKKDNKYLTESAVDRRVDAKLAAEYARKYPERRKKK